MKSSVETLFSLPLVRGLLNQSVTTIWVEMRDDGNRIKIRNAPKGPVETVPSADFGSILTAVSSVLNGRDSVDVTVNQVEIMITRVTVIGGMDWVMTTTKASNATTFASALSVTV